MDKNIERLDEKIISSYTSGIIRLLVELVGTYKPNRDNIREVDFDYNMINQ